DREDSRYPRWREYSYIESMELAGAYDRCFTYDAERRRLVFGDNENGEAPPRGSENIMIISCSATKGAQGNLPPMSLNAIDAVGESYPVSQYEPCRGGRNRESFRHAMDRLKLSLSECTRAVTAEDYRTLALKTPGLRVADAKAVPHTANTIYENRTGSDNVISLVVLPYSNSSFPMPDSRFIAAVQEHIENYRLITTKVNVVAPVYVKIDITADIICGTREVQQAKRHSEAAIRSLLSVYGSDGRTRFGEPVGESDIITAICSVDGILSVKRLSISTEMHGCSRDRYGRLVIPYNAIAYCGDVSLNVTEP
ncbi:MAG: baseplate J/gp47 family protein, partial [Oscillospiraceae bacterium]